MIVLASLIAPNLENHGTEASPAPANGAELFRIVVLLVDQVDLVEDLLRLSQADTMFLFDGAALGFLELQLYQYRRSRGNFGWHPRPDGCKRIPRSATDALVGLVESAVTRGSGTGASRADLGIRPTRQNLLEANRLKGRRLRPRGAELKLRDAEDVAVPDL